MKRLFISIPLDREAEYSFAEYRDVFGRIGYLRWTPVKNLHMTVLFVGSVSEENIPFLTAAVHEAVFGLAPFLLPFEKVQYAPPGKPAKMVWAYFKLIPEFQELVIRVHETVSRISEPEETVKRSNGTDILPHITLARFKDRVPPRELIKLKQPEEPITALAVSNVELMESRLMREGSEYVPIETFPLIDR
jgi:2'-5' RNA ligase